MNTQLWVDSTVYIYIYVCMYMYVCVYIFIEREGPLKLYIYHPGESGRSFVIPLHTSIVWSAALSLLPNIFDLHASSPAETVTQRVLGTVMGNTDLTRTSTTVLLLPYYRQFYSASLLC